MLLHKYYCDLLKDFSFYTHDVHTNNLLQAPMTAAHVERILAATTNSYIVILS